VRGCGVDYLRTRGYLWVHAGVLILCIRSLIFVSLCMQSSVCTCMCVYVRAFVHVCVHAVCMYMSAGTCVSMWAVPTCTLPCPSFNSLVRSRADPFAACYPRSLGFHGKHIKCNQCLNIYHTACVDKVRH